MLRLKLGGNTFYKEQNIVLIQNKGGINMEYVRFGKTDLNVSRLCLGTMGFGAATAGQHTWTLDEEKSKEIIRHALDLGI